jgi:hypothetical protein
MNKRVTSCFLSAAVLLAALAGGVGSATAAVAASCAPALHGVSVAPASVPGGAPATVTVTLTCAAPKPVAVALKGFPGIAVPASLTVPKGKAAAAAAVRTATRKTATRGTIAATLGKVRKTAALAVAVTPKTCKTPVLAGFTLPSLGYDSGHPAAVVKLNCAAAAAVRVSLRSSDSYLPVPATVTIGRYYAAATVPLTPKTYEAGQFKATVTARLGGKSLARTITVDPGISAVAISPAGGFPDEFDVEVLTTGVVLAGGMTVSLHSSSPAVTMPATFTVPAGSVGSMIPGIKISEVAKNTPITLSATFGGVTKSASYVLVPPWNSHDKLTVVPENGPGPLYGLENSVDYFIDLSNPAPDGGLTADVTFGDPAALQLSAPPPVMFIAGQQQLVFEVDVANVTSAVQTTITVSVDGVSDTIPVAIEPGLASFSLPATISSGTTGATATGTVSLAGPVSAPTTVDLQSSDGILSVPLSVTIPAGQSSATFAISVVQVTSDTSVFITGSLGGTTLQSADIDVTP